MNNLSFVKALWSPFKPFKIKFYFGETKIGVPYFLPRKLIPDPQKPGYQMSIYKKIGFDFVGLGWKTKWESYRFEWSPLFSFVFLGYQLVVTVFTEHDSHYWESWLYYERNTDKSKSKQERIIECIKNAPQIWTTYNGDEKKTINYYTLILRKKYLKIIELS